MLKFAAPKATLKAMKISAKGNDDAIIDAVDFTFECVVDGDITIDLLGTEELPNFWHKNSDKDALFTGLTNMNSWAEFDAEKLNFGPIKFKTAELKSFSFKPIAGEKIELSFRAFIREPTDTQVNGMRHALKSSHKLVVAAEGDLFDPEEEEEEQKQLEV